MLNAMLNISDTLNDGLETADTGVAPDPPPAPRPEPGSPSGGAPAPAAQSARDRRGLERELLDEMTSWTPGDRRGAFKTWHRHSLSLVHLNVLTGLEAEGPLSMKRLAEIMDVSDASATGIVERMEKRGLVERRHDAADRRVVLVHPTEAGARVFSDMADQRRKRLSQVLARLSHDEMAALLVGMRAIRTAGRQLAETSDPPSADDQDG